MWKGGGNIRRCKLKEDPRFQKKEGREGGEPAPHRVPKKRKGNQEVRGCIKLNDEAIEGGEGKGSFAAKTNRGGLKNDPESFSWHQGSGQIISQ